MTAAPTAVQFEHRPAGEPALGLGLAEPRLSWQLPGADHDHHQQVAELEITRRAWGGAESTETVSVEGDAQVLVPWPTAPLMARERARVRVRVRSGDEWSEWSEPAVVEAGLLAPADWQADLVSPATIGGMDAGAPSVGSPFQVDGEVAEARLHLTAHGWYEARLNGERVSGDWFGPGWTVYPQRLRSYTYDVTDQIRTGENRLDILLGNGWFRGQLAWEMKRAHYGERLGALVRLDVLTTDGRTHTLTSDGSWTARETHILHDDIYDGETQDLRRPLLAEETSGVEIQELDLDTLVGAEGPAVRVVDTLPATRVWRSPAGKLLVDFGQNVVGFCRLRIRGASAGTEVTLRHAEVLEHDELGIRPLRKAKATDTYTLADGDNVLEPHFTFHGFRYAQVDGVDELDPADIDAVVLSSAMTRSGWFECSEPLLNRLHENVVWGMRGNFVDVPTDCPQRDERLGWTGDIQVFSPTALYLHDAAGFLSSWARDLAAEQSEDGNVPIVIPDVLHAPMTAAAWGDAAVVVPWQLYLATGDEDVLRRQLDSMRGWVDKVETLTSDRLWIGGFQFGDWLDADAPPDNPAGAKADADVVATACWFHCADLLAQAASVIGEDAIAAQYARLADEIKEAFSRRFVTADGRIISDAPTVYAQAIVWGMLTPDQTQAAGDRLADLARIASFRVSTGFVGTPLITDALSMTGHVDIAYRLLQEQGCPSWLYPVTMGATTIWERWDSMLPDGTINPGEMTSFNHYALGAVADWMHRVVGGLAPAAPGWKRIRVAPEPGGTLTSASTAHDTPYGRASVAWRRDGDEVSVRAEIPAGTTAEVVLPDGTRAEVGHGTHSWTCALPVSEAPRPQTVRDLIDDPVRWPRVIETITARGTLPDAAAVTGMLKRYFDAPAALTGDAATAFGMMPNSAGVGDEVREILRS